MHDLKTGGQTPTPRTDAIFDKIETPLIFEYETMRDFARTLERELNEMTEACNHWMDRYEQEHKDLAAHTEDRAMLETREANAESYTLLLTDYTRVVAERDALTAQLDAARRERDEARDSGWTQQRVDDAIKSTNRRWRARLDTAFAERDALRAELEAVNAKYQKALATIDELNRISVDGEEE